MTPVSTYHTACYLWSLLIEYEAVLIGEMLALKPRQFN